MLYLFGEPGQFFAFLSAEESTTVQSVGEQC